MGRATRIAAVLWAAQHQPRGTLSSHLLGRWLSVAAGLGPLPRRALQAPCRYGAVLPGSSPRARLVGVRARLLCAQGEQESCVCRRPCCPSWGHVPGCFVRRARGRAGAVLTFLVGETTVRLGSSGYQSSSTVEGNGSSFFPVSLILLKLDLLKTWPFSPLLEQSISGIPFSLLKLFLGKAVRWKEKSFYLVQFVDACLACDALTFRADFSPRAFK